MHLGALILTALLGTLLVAAGRAQVQQEPWAETTEGIAITINCSHPNIKLTEFIHWYRQLPGRAPQWLVSSLRGSQELRSPSGRLWVSADRRSSGLWLSKPRHGDAAVYWCAFRANSWTQLLFGSGTTLSIQPRESPSPSVYRLLSKDAEDLEMCLLTDYAPENMTFGWGDKQTNAVVEVTTPTNEQEASCLSSCWAKRDEMQCTANHRGFGQLQPEDPESGASPVCVTGVSLHFRTDESLNMLSLSQLCLKAVLMKGMIFNVVMTMLMWKKRNESHQMVQS
ncbi:M1-specific T cell receptor alpha chain-like [Colius striatus]|uniref:M1-specific T cell receptor alpha chain-like n=1 Tax=Colius striatus TaxID=57412 RepID=UPI002B1D57A6|nr:M1-specific T cell receptor alpha chain-like [Colius striatus]